MGIKIDLPIHDLEEANFLNKLLLDTADQALLYSQMHHTTPDEKIKYANERELALRLHDRMIQS